MLFHVEDYYTSTNGFVATVASTKWFGRFYGLGFGTGLGYAAFTRNRQYGWTGDSVATVFYASPVVIRFGGRVRFEASLNGGVIEFFSQSPQPWGYFAFSVLI